MSQHLNAALILLDRALEEIENGFVPCQRCGDQEDTKDLDFVDDLKATKSELLKAVGEEKAGGESGSEADLTSGVWFQSTVSGLWYQNPEPAGSVRIVLVNGRSYFKSGS